MVNKKIVAAVLALIILLSGIAGGCADKPGSYKLSAAWCQDIADGIKAMQPTEIPGSIAVENRQRNSSEFDPNGYFSVFKHLSINGGYLLDYIYFLNELGGTPLLYTLQKDQDPYLDFYDFGKAGTTVTRPENDVSLIWLTKDKKEEVKYGSQIKIDKSSKGYYEYTVLQLLGGQFYLYYKAMVYDLRIVCEPDVIETILGNIVSSGLAPIDDGFKTAARALDLQPVVEVEEDSATVSMVIFTMWGGFSRVNFTISRDYPHTVTKYENQNILRYDCGLKL